jgi:hypothetical protein
MGDNTASLIFDPRGEQSHVPATGKVVQHPLSSKLGGPQNQTLERSKITYTHQILQHESSAAQPIIQSPERGQIQDSQCTRKEVK